MRFTSRADLIRRVAFSRQVTFLALLALGASLSLGLGAAATSLQMSVPEKLVIDKKALEGSLPVLDTGQRERITADVIRDPTVSQLLSGHPWTLAQAVPWVRSDGSILGGEVRLVLDSRSSLVGTWDAVQYSCSDSGTPPYAVSRYWARRAHVRYLSVLVDIDRNAIVAIDPDPGSSLVGGVRWIKRALEPQCQPIG